MEYVIISVSGGVALASRVPQGIKVFIVDHDNRTEEEDASVDVSSGPLLCVSEETWAELEKHGYKIVRGKVK